MDQNTIETEEEIGLPKQPCLVSASIHGETDIAGMSDRLKRVETFKRNFHWQTVVPCQACSNCIEFRKFLPDGQAVSTGFYCFQAEMFTEEYATCDYAHSRKNGRRRVVYDGENAPIGFREGLAPVQIKRYFTKKERVKASLEAAKQSYRGGSSAYQRADGNKEAVGSGKIPKGLGN